MKHYLLAALVVGCLSACGDKKNEAPTTAMDAGRTFIRASLDGDFTTAESLLLNDSLNQQLFKLYEEQYQKFPSDKKKHYKEASYNINKMEDVNDSTAIINYSNSYMNKPMEIKLVRQHKNWLIDFKYTSSGNLPIN